MDNGTTIDKDDIQVISGFVGYQNNSDITTVGANTLVPPAQNMLITGDTVKCVESRGGYKLLGSARTQTGNGIRSKYDDFVNGLGIKLPIREWVNNNTSHSVFQVYYNGDWRPLTGNTDFPHEIYFFEWYNDETSLPILGFVGGNTNIDYWGGGITTVVSSTATTVTVADEIAQLGFTPAGTFFVNGVTFAYTGYTGTQFTGVTPNPTGFMAAGDVLTAPIITTQLQRLAVPLTNVPTLDICMALNNHIFYGSYATRVVYVSNSFNTKSLQQIVQTSTVLDDIQVSGDYVAATESIIKIVITEAVPTPRTTATISPTGIDDAIFGGIFVAQSDTVITVAIDSITPDTFSWSVNGTVIATLIPIDGTAQPLGTTGITITFAHGSTGHVVGDTYSLIIGRGDDDPTNGNTDKYTWYTEDANGNFITPTGPIPVTTPLVYNGVTISWNSFNGHKVGDFWLISFVPPVVTGFADTYFSTPARKPGQGALVKLDSPPTVLAQQEQFGYALTRAGLITTLAFEPSADLLTENINAQRLKTDFSNKALRQELLVHTKNYLAYMNIENQLVNLGRVEDILQTPMSEIISLPVKNEFISLKFVTSLDGNGNGQVSWADNKIFITVPSAGLWYIYDAYYQLWNPPQTGNFSAISVINGQVCAHSSISDETYILFSASNDNGYPFRQIFALAYNSDGRYPAGYSMLTSYDTNTRRDRLKEVSKLFVEAYKTSNTNLYGTVNLEWGNANGGGTYRLDPIVKTPLDAASIGASNLAHHGLANDPVKVLTKFHFVQPFNRDFVYEHQIVLMADNIDAYFKVVSVGTNALIVDQRNIVIQQVAHTTEVPTFPGVPGTPLPLNSSGGGNLTGDSAAGIDTGGAG